MLDLVSIDIKVISSLGILTDKFIEVRLTREQKMVHHTINQKYFRYFQKQGQGKLVIKQGRNVEHMYRSKHYAT